MRGASAEETLCVKEAYDFLASTHVVMVCAYRADNRRFLYPQFKEAVQTCGIHIIYCGVGSHHQNTIFECSIKEFNLGSHTLLLHTTRSWTEAASTMLWPFYFKAAHQS